MSFSESTNEALRMLRLQPRQEIQTNSAMKKPTGGRANPCATVSDPGRKQRGPKKINWKAHFRGYVD